MVRRADQHTRVTAPRSAIDRLPNALAPGQAVRGNGRWFNMRVGSHDANLCRMEDDQIGAARIRASKTGSRRRSATTPPPTDATPTAGRAAPGDSAAESQPATPRPRTARTTARTANAVPVAGATSEPATAAKRTPRKPTGKQPAADAEPAAPPATPPVRAARAKKAAAIGQSQTDAEAGPSGAATPRTRSRRARPPVAQTGAAHDVLPLEGLEVAPAPRKAPEKPATAKAAEPAAAKPVEPAEPAEPAAEPARPAASAEPAAQTVVALWTSIRANPAYAPELLALAAVAHLGPQVHAHTAWLRATYPTATADGLARLATQRFVRQARRQGAAAGLTASLTALTGPLALVTGPAAALAETARNVWTQAQLALHLAAAYGLDPTDPRRAAELLAMQGLHRDLAAAEAAVTTARRASRNGTIRLAAPASILAGRGAVRLAATRRVGRLLPGAGAIVGALTSARAAERLAVRATSLYRNASRSATT